MLGLTRQRGQSGMNDVTAPKEDSLPEYRYDRSKQIAVLKVLYLLAVTMVTFIVPTISARSASWFVVVGLFAGQVTALLLTRIPVSDILTQTWRLKWLFVLLVGGYTLLPPENPASGDALLLWHPLGSTWRISINLTGLEQAALMSFQILTVLLASFLVRATGTGRDLIVGLEAFRLPALFVHALDNTLELLGGARRQRGATGSRPDRPGFFGVLRLIMHSDFAFFARTIRAKIETAAHLLAQSGAQPLNPRLAHDVVVITGITLCMASLKMLKVLPGVPFAPGHKMVLIFPLYVIASRLTYSRWGATAAGSIMGVIGLLQGDGRFGLLEVLKHIAPGLVIDLCHPLARRLPPWALWYFILGTPRRRRPHCHRVRPHPAARCARRTIHFPGCETASESPRGIPQWVRNSVPPESPRRLRRC